MTALNRKLLRDLWQMRGQVLAIAAVIMGGVATLVMALSTYDSLHTTRDRFYSDYGFAQVFASLKRAPEGMAERVAGLPGVNAVETRVVTLAKLEVPNFSDPIVGIISSLPDNGQPRLNRLHLKHGRLPLPYSEYEAVVSDTFADAHKLKPGDHISAIINGRHQTLNLVGVAMSPEYVYQIAPGAMFPDFKRFGVIWMGRHALAVANDMDGAFNDLSLTLTPGSDEQTVIEQIDNLLARYGGIGAYGRENQFSNRFLSEELKQLKTTATLFPAIFLGVAAFLLNVVVSRMIATQRDQIAILKAFGYGDWAIGSHYLKMVLAIAFLGVAMGIALGAWFGVSLSRVYMDFYRFPYLDYVLRPLVFVIALLVTGFAAVSGTVLTVGRAMRLTPAEGMRPDTPLVYRTTLIERIGLKRWFSQPSRMILRHIERRPAKSLLTVVGIACACGLMMVGDYQRGAVEYMIDVQFNQSAREDLAVTFTNPADIGALHEIASLPGVRQVEGFRDVAANLRFEQHQYRAALFGIEPDSTLHHALDTHLRPIHVPPGGVVLTDHLANRILHVKPGDTLTVEILEGNRRIVQVPVLGITKQYLGVSAYMQRDSLNALLREGDVISGVYLSHDPGAEAAIYKRLQARPNVLGLIAHANAIRSFYATMGEFVLFFNMIAALLAASIAFGVVYNSARIALSERGRELASLRVLGFTRAEIAYILLGELGILTLAAIPVGFLIGVGLCGVLVLSFNSELYRLPLVLEPYNYAMAASVVLASAVISGLLTWRTLGKLDLVAVLKTRE
jgi:putative ABC transport system permease protein